MSRFLISCGGTGGHLSPGIALAEGLIERGHRVKLLISQKRVDARLIEKYPALEFVRIPGTGFAWRPVALARFCWHQTCGFGASLRLVRRFQPDAVVGFGGFTSAAFIAAGALLGVPVVLHESNRVPGRAIRLLGRFAERVYLPPGVSLGSVGAAALREVGLPVRREFRRQPDVEARVALGLERDAKTVVVLGGSQGASALNEWARREMPVLAAAGLQLYCVTGLGKGEPETVEMRARGGGRVRAVFAPFCDRMSTLLSAADLVVSRAGAGTLAELIRSTAPALLVPYPQAADNHQAANADYFRREGGGEVIAQTELTRLGERVLAVALADDVLAAFRQNLERMGRVDPLAYMVGDLEAIAGQGKKRAAILPGAAGVA